MVTLKDIAREAGVSTATVSFILNGLAEEKKFSKATKEKVLRIAMELNYQPNLSAKKLRTAKEAEYSICLYWASNMRVQSLSCVLQSLQQECLQSKIPVNITTRPFFPGKLKKDYYLHKAASFDGAIFATITDEDLLVLESDPPLFSTVLLNRRSAVFDSVISNNDIVGKLAGEHLISRGVKHPVYISNKHLNSFLSSRLRLKSFMDMCSRSGLDMPEASVIQAEDNAQGGYDACDALLKSGSVPDGIFCNDINQALGVMRALKQHGISVPEEVKVMTLSYGRSVICDYSFPAISYVQVPIEKMGISAVRNCINNIENKQEKAKPKISIFTPKLVINEST